MKVSNKFLERIKSQNFLEDVGFDLPPAVMREHLRRLPEFNKFKDLIKSSIITFEIIDEFVESVLINIKKGEHFPFNVVLAFIAVVLEDNPSIFAEEYICGLAILNVSEVAVATRIANECIKHREKEI
jgi:hypothetical protein